MESPTRAMRRSAAASIPGSEVTLVSYEAVEVCKEREHEFIEMTCTCDASPTKSVSLSQCRYCYQDIEREACVSSCHCQGTLCQSCLIKELALTYNRGIGITACTVCQMEYKLTGQSSWDWKTDVPLFCCHHLKCCGLRPDEFLMSSTVGAIGFTLVIIGVSAWILSSAILFAVPSHTFPLFVFYMLASFDFAIMVLTFWFVDKCRCLTTFCISILYLLRASYMVLGYVTRVHFIEITITGEQYLNVVAYFLCFSVVAFVLLTVIWIKNIRRQVMGYKRRRQTLFVNGRCLGIVRDQLSLDEVPIAHESAIIR